MPQTYTFASWNVNGLRAVLKKDPSFIQIAQELDVDILALQETKLQEGQVDIDLPGYHQTWSYAERKGYSGTAVFSRQEPLRVLRADALLPYAGEGEAAELVAQAATEGRVCALEFDKFWFVDVYTPNAQNELARIDVRMAWDDAYRGFLSALERETGKPVVTCGDFNVAHEEIDLKNPKSNRGNAGFSDEEHRRRLHCVRMPARSSGGRIVVSESLAAAIVPSARAQGANACSRTMFGADGGRGGA